MGHRVPVLGHATGVYGRTGGEDVGRKVVLDS